MNMSRPNRPALLLLVAALAMAGCATHEVKPNIEAPQRFAAAPVSAAEPEVAWWEGYGDPVLANLMQRAARENRDVKIAAARVRAARAGETISRSFLMPSIGVAAFGLDHRANYADPLKAVVPDAKAIAGGLDVSWEVDISGRLRAAADAASADALAAQDAERAVRLLVLTDVATNYFTLKGALRQLDTVRAISAARDETLRLVTARQRVGLATSFDVERARTEAESARAAIPPLETLAAVSRNRLAVLVGDQAVNAARIEPDQGDAAVPATRAGQPASILERRPDLLAARAQVDAANARRRQAAAEWFPRLFVSAMLGGQDVVLNGASLGSARFTNAAAMLAMPIFNAGRTQAINEAAGSAQTEAVLRYEGAIVRALEDVENALVALGDQRRRNESLAVAAESADGALTRAQSLYDRGQIDLLPLLDAQRTRLAVQMAANDSRTQLLLDSVRLYKALGGGWEAFEPPAATTASRATHAPGT
jgi:NodT family efflux transporter outer membrane factor (OMF) lipoprotein